MEQQKRARRHQPLYRIFRLFRTKLLYIEGDRRIVCDFRLASRAEAMEALRARAGRSLFDRISRLPALPHAENVDAAEDTEDEEHTTIMAALLDELDADGTPLARGLALLVREHPASCSRWIAEKRGSSLPRPRLAVDVAATMEEAWEVLASHILGPAGEQNLSYWVDFLYAYWRGREGQQEHAPLRRRAPPRARRGGPPVRRSWWQARNILLSR